MSINYTSSFKTTLKAVVVVSPEQLNNDLYMNIKGNLEKRLVGKGYHNYGLIEKIYNIQKISDGKIKQEDNDCNVYFDVDFNCRVVKPTIHNIIIGKVATISPEYILLTSGSIKAIVKNKHIGDNYILDNTLGIYKNKTNGKEIEIGDYFKMEIYKYQMMDKEKVIYVSASIIEEASDEEVEKHYDSVYGEMKEDDDNVDDTDINDIIE